MSGSVQALQTSQPAGLDDASFAKLSALIHEESGIVLSANKRNLIVSRLSKRLRALNLPDFAAYCRYLDQERGAEELRTLIPLVTTNVTRFLREDHHFEALRRDVLPPLVAKARSGARVRFWSAGCSTGEEPFSLAMTILETCPEANKLDLRILATDIDPEVIRTAKAASFPSIEEGHLSPAQRRMFFEPDDAVSGRIRAKANLRDLVTFAELNLLRDWPMSGLFDVVFCRNVVIYFDAETQARLWTRFADILVPGGQLFLGHSERADASREQRLRPNGVTQYCRI